MEGRGPSRALPFQISDMSLFHAVQNGSHQATNDTRFSGLCATFLRHILLEFVRQLRNRKGLQPHTTRAGESCEENAVSAKYHVADTRDAHDLEVHPNFECPDVARVHSQQLTRLKVLYDQLTGELEPCHPYAADPLEEESVASEDAGTERLLKPNPKLNACCRTKEAVSMNEKLPVHS